MTKKLADLEERRDPKENGVENIIAAAVVILVIGAIVWLAMRPAEETERRAAMSVGVSPSIGDGLLVVEFSDFECPYCSEFALVHFPEIKEQYIDTGQVRFAYKHFPLTQIHENAFLAAQAASCAYDQDSFWEYHDILYAHQDALQKEHLLTYAQDLELDMEEFQTCISEEKRKEEVLRNKDQGIKAGVTGTPTFFFNGRRVVGSLTAEEFGKELAKELQ